MDRIEAPERTQLIQEGIEFAKEAGLRYVSDREPGFKRKRKGKGFFYLDPDNTKVSCDKTLHRIRSLVLPPAWEDVWICKIGNGHLQATGRDARERKQYRYHAKWCETRNETKFDRLAEFATALPKIRKQIRKHLKETGMSREKIVAAVLQIMEQTMIRVGNDLYAQENDSYGLTTIKNKHVKVMGAKASFSFKGKSGVAHQSSLTDARLAKIIRQCQELPGQELFNYTTEDGRVCDIGSHDVNELLREWSGLNVSAKDFRTWGGTVHAAKELFKAKPLENETIRARKSRDLRVIESTAAFLGNTVAVCRKYYIHPAIFAADREGRLLEAFKKAKSKPEAAVFALIS